MQVILKEDVQKLGRAGDTVKVADGYGRNFLLPKALAVMATPANMKRLEQELNSKKGQAKRQQMDAQYLADAMQAKPVVIKTACGEAGKLFGSVTSADIEKVLAERNITVDKRKIELTEPIKLLGQYDVMVKLHPDVTAKLTVVVEDEHAKPESSPAPADSSDATPVAEEEPAAAAAEKMEPEAVTEGSGDQDKENQPSE